jgi:hypothetical protein
MLKVTVVEPDAEGEGGDRDGGQGRVLDDHAEAEAQVSREPGHVGLER